MSKNSIIVPHIQFSADMEFPLSGMQTALVEADTPEVLHVEGSLPFLEETASARSDVLGALIAELLDAGTKMHTKDELRQLLAAKGASLSFFFDGRSLRFSGMCAKQDASLLFGLLAEQLRFSTFSAREVAAEVRHLRSQILIEADNARAQARRALTRLLYPENSHQYAYTSEELLAALSDITPRDVRSYYRARAGLGRVRIAVVGDLKGVGVPALLQRGFFGWRSGHSCEPLSNGATNIKQRRAYLSMPAKQTTEYMLGQHVPLTSHDEAYLPLALGLVGLGGGPSALLFQELREKRGLTYGAAVRLGYFGPRTSGHWYAWTMFPPDVFEKGKALTRSLVESYAAKGPRPAAFSMLKEQLINKHLLTLADAAERAKAYLGLMEDERDLTYIAEYPKRVADISHHDVVAAVSSYIDPKKFCEAAAGPITASGKPLNINK